MAKKFLAQRRQAVLPTEITVGERIYKVLSFLRGEDHDEVNRGEDHDEVNVMVARAKKMKAHLGQDDGEHLLEHRGDIPVALQGEVVFVFTDWPHPINPDGVACVYWLVGHWVQGWIWFSGDWDDRSRVLRRKS